MRFVWRWVQISERWARTAISADGRSRSPGSARIACSLAWRCTVAETAAIEYGAHRGLNFDSYAQIQAANHSTLERFRQSAAHARYYMLSGGDEETQALRKGWAVHAAVLEPSRF